MSTEETKETTGITDVKEVKKKKKKLRKALKGFIKIALNNTVNFAKKIQSFYMIDV